MNILLKEQLNGEKVRFKCKYWSKDIYVEQRIKEIKRNIREIEMIAFDEKIYLFDIHTFDVWEEIGGEWITMGGGG